MRNLVVGMAIGAFALAFAGRAEAAKTTLLDKKLHVSEELGGDYGAARAEAEKAVDEARAKGHSVLHMNVFDDGGGAGSPLWWVLEWIGGGIAGFIVAFIIGIPVGIIAAVIIIGAAAGAADPAAIAAAAAFTTLLVSVIGLLIIPPVVVGVVQWMASSFDNVQGDFWMTLLYTYLAWAVSAAVNIAIGYLAPGLWFVGTIVGLLAGLMPVYATNFLTAGGGSDVPADARRDAMLKEDRHGLTPRDDVALAPTRPVLSFAF